MDERTRNLKGSESRDIFKRYHKDLDSAFYACDADFCLVSKYPPGTVAYMDYKAPGDSVTFSEGIQYNEWMKVAPVYIVEGADPQNGPFIIRRYLGADWKPNPPIVKYGKSQHCKNWREFGDWERRLRNEYKKRGGWNGCLKQGS